MPRLPYKRGDILIWFDARVRIGTRGFTSQCTDDVQSEFDTILGFKYVIYEWSLPIMISFDTIECVRIPREFGTKFASSNSFFFAIKQEFWQFL